MSDDVFYNVHNPDVLSCLANLSNDEVFTPPEIANKMLDMLPQELFSDKYTKFLDPCCKSGVFLREIAKRLITKLDNEKYPDFQGDENLQKRIDHVFNNQLYGIAITQLTSLLSRRSVYCSKDASCKYSVTNFGNSEGKIYFEPAEHDWSKGTTCKYCGASSKTYGGRSGLESHAYQFIHYVTPGEIKDMKFDVIIGNPPYQLSDGGGTGSSAIPIYNHFIQAAKKLKPRFLTMIVPSRWFVGGKGLDDFRDAMLHDNSLRIIHDYFDAGDCFPGVEIKGGVCYFLWDRDHKGLCKVYSHEGNKVISEAERPLLEENSDIFIRFNEAISIYKKIQSKNEASFMDLVSTRKPFGFDSKFKDFTKTKKNDDDILIYANKCVGYLPKTTKIPQNKDFIQTWKVYISFGYGAGEGFPHQILNTPILGKPNSCCTETYLHIGAFRTQQEAENAMSYMATKFFRFAVMLKKNTQNGTKQVYQFVPMQDFSKSWTDDELYKKYELTDSEIKYIESMIKEMVL